MKLPFIPRKKRKDEEEKKKKKKRKREEKEAPPFVSRVPDTGVPRGSIERLYLTERIEV